MAGNNASDIWNIRAPNILSDHAANCKSYLRRLPEGNYEVLGLGEPVVVKEHYWTCPDTGESGNAIDFMMRFRGLSFAEAMDLLS